MSLVSPEKNVQILVCLLKQHGIRHVIASPGNTNTAFVGTVQNDPFFKIYSVVDERSAAYVACGMAEELGKPVVISCTGATSSRNYLPGLTEAYYRKLPVLAITSSQSFSKIGHHVAQVIDRSTIPKDVAKCSVALPVVKDADDQWDCEIKVNKAILELDRKGGGPVHINLPTTYSKPFIRNDCSDVQFIERFSYGDNFPNLSGKVAVFVGAHKVWSADETKALEQFCDLNNAVVFCDHTSGYHGKYRLQFAIVASQEMLSMAQFRPDITIYIGEITGDYSSISLVGESVWRVNEDGEVRDPFQKLRYVFEMSEKDFFMAYINSGDKSNNIYYKVLSDQLNEIRERIPEVPFSNIWAASKLASKIPEKAIMYFGILNSLRSWNFFELPASVRTTSNVGGFGIDGGVSSLVGMSLVNADKLCFCVTGDLSFFYDMNIIGNRHIKHNLRVLLINNGQGTEFRLYDHYAYYFGEQANEYIAASRHFGNKSANLVKDFSESLGFKYLSATNKEQFNKCYEEFTSSNKSNKPILFEIFTDGEDESLALQMIQNIEITAKGKAKKLAKKLIGSEKVSAIKNIIRD